MSGDLLFGLGLGVSELPGGVMYSLAALGPGITFLGDQIRT